MFKKIGWLFLIFFISYILLIFSSPEIGGSISGFLGLKSFNNSVVEFKSTYDETVTTIPTKNEFNNAYDTLYKFVTDFGNHFKQGLDITKSKLDSIREDIGEKKKSVEEIKAGYDQIKQVIDTTSGTIQNTKNILDNINDLKNTISGSGIVENNNNTGIQTTDTGMINDTNNINDLKNTISGSGIVENNNNTGIQTTDTGMINDTNNLNNN